MNNRRRIGCCGGSLIVVIAGAVALGLWVNKICKVPEIRIPVVKMPSPNAFDYFAAAGRMAAADAKALTLPDRPANSKIRSLTGKEKAALLAKHKDALSKVREGFKYDYLFPPRYSIASLFPEYRQFMALARLFVIEGEAAEAQKRYGDAMNSYLDAMRLGVIMPKGTSDMGMVTGISCENWARPAAWNVISKLDAVQARNAARQMESLEAARVPIEQIAITQKWMTLGVIKEGLEGKSPEKTMNMISQMSDYQRARVVVTCTKQADERIAECRKPYPSRRHIDSNDTRKLNFVNAPADIIVTLLDHPFDGISLITTNAAAQDRLLMVALALQACKTENGRYPKRLGDLAPTYIKRIPSDPFALHGSFKYRFDRNGYVLYSIGPDGKDDGGKPALNPDKNSKNRYLVDIGSKGDLVAGVSL